MLRTNPEEKYVRMFKHCFTMSGEDVTYKLEKKTGI